MSASIAIKWDRAPVRQSFGACNVVFDGVATVNGKSYRINGSANRACREIEIALRYLTHAKRGGIVPASMLHDVRMAAMQSAAELLAPMRAEWMAPLRAELLALIRAETVSAPIRLRQLRGPDGQSVLVPTPLPLNALPVVITKPGEYVTRAGGKAIVHDVKGHSENVTAFAAKGSLVVLFRGKMRPRGLQIWHVSGRAFPLSESPHDIVAPVVDQRARVAANIAALSAPVMVANTSRACYWRLSGGYVATGPDVTPVDNGQGYGLLSALMRLKGESHETIARVLGGL